MNLDPSKDELIQNAILLQIAIKRERGFVALRQKTLATTSTPSAT
jgi:hypothetical protein